MRRKTLALLTMLATSASPALAGNTIFVATNGSDGSGDGSSGSPYATISQAVNRASDGDLILVRSGDYFGRIRLDRIFTNGITIRSEEPYGARLRNSSQVMTSFSGQGFTVEGFDIAHSGSGASPVVVQIQDTISGPEATSRITLRNNIMHDSYNNDILKINNGARSVVVDGNIFYNQSGSDEHMDVNSVTDVTITNNVFLNDFGASGRGNGNNTSSFVVIKDSNADSDEFLGASDITVAGNVFLNWQGGVGFNFLLLGEDGASYFEARDVLIENNLMIGNSPNAMRAAFGGKGVRDVVFRHNTVVGNLPANGFAFRLNREGSNPIVTNVEFYNNIWSDPTGSMNRFSNTPSGQSTGTVLNNNLYWNGGSSLPNNNNDITNPNDDNAAVEGDPELGSQSGLAVPTWNAQSGAFRDGSTSIEEVRRTLVQRYGTPGSGSAAIDLALSTQVPGMDILGNPRSSASADIGAVERDNPNVLFQNGFE